MVIDLLCIIGNGWNPMVWLCSHECWLNSAFLFLPSCFFVCWFGHFSWSTLQWTVSIGIGNGSIWGKRCLHYGGERERERVHLISLAGFPAKMHTLTMQSENIIQLYTYIKMISPYIPLSLTLFSTFCWMHSPNSSVICNIITDTAILALDIAFVAHNNHLAGIIRVIPHEWLSSLVVGPAGCLIVARTALCPFIWPAAVQLYVCYWAIEINGSSPWIQKLKLDQIRCIARQAVTIEYTYVRNKRSIKMINNHFGMFEYGPMEYDMSAAVIIIWMPTFNWSWHMVHDICVQC